MPSSARPIAVIRLHPDDSVAVALRDIATGEILRRADTAVPDSEALQRDLIWTTFAVPPAVAAL